MKSTSDVWFSAFLLHENITLATYVANGNKVTCSFELTDEQWKELKIKFHNSEISKFKGYIEKIKDLAH
jgi:hypothetical protein